MSDLINREDAIEAWDKLSKRGRTEFDQVLMTLPSAKAEPKTGEWILVCDSEGEGDNLYRCSECGCEYGCQEYDKPNFCLDCGAKMFKKDSEFK